MLHNLSYVGFTSPNADDWRPFATDILGAELAPDGPDGEVRVRIDDQAWRIAIHPGDRNDVAYFGWQVVDDDARAALHSNLEAAGIEVHADAATASERQVATLDWFVDPFGFRHELISGAGQAGPITPGRPLDGSFVTGEQGVGHVVLIVPDLEAGHTFVTEVMGMRISDYIDGKGGELRFYHCPGSAARHHTVALSAAPNLRGFHHLMIEVTDVDDVGRGLDLAKAAGHPIAMDFGKHPNDLMTSFYVRTPSGFELEYGCGGVVIDDAHWETARYDATSIWGHLPPADGRLRPGIMAPVTAG